MTDNAMMYSEGPKLSTYEKDALTAIDKIYEDYPEETQFAVLTGIWVTVGIGTVFSGIRLRNKYKKKKCA